MSGRAKRNRRAPPIYNPAQSAKKLFAAASLKTPPASKSVYKEVGSLRFCLSCVYMHFCVCIC